MSERMTKNHLDDTEAVVAKWGSVSTRDAELLIAEVRALWAERQSDDMLILAADDALGGLDRMFLRGWSQRSTKRERDAWWRTMNDDHRQAHRHLHQRAGG